MYNNSSPVHNIYGMCEIEIVDVDSVNEEYS